MGESPAANATMMRFKVGLKSFVVEGGVNLGGWLSGREVAGFRKSHESISSKGNLANKMATVAVPMLMAGMGL